MIKELTKLNVLLSSIIIKSDINGCGKKFWSNYYGASLIPISFLRWHRVRCGEIYLVEGKALCQECQSLDYKRKNNHLNKILKGSFLENGKIKRT